jgi:hypothetical protein
VLRVLSELEEAINSKIKHHSIKQDLLKIKDEMRKTLTDFLNNFTRLILSNVENEMEKIDAIRCKFYYECDIFRNFIWGFRLVPLPPE